MSTPPPAPVVRNRSRFRRPIWIILGLVAALFLSWLAHGYWQDWADAKAWREYLAELEKREPNWRERVYGRPATSEEEKTRKELIQLNTAIPGDTINWSTWTTYRTSLYGGFLQDPSRPQARLTDDQHAFLKWMQEVMMPFFEKGHLIDAWQHIAPHFPDDMSFDRVINQGNLEFGQLFTLNELVELQALFQMQENRPSEAAKWICRCIKLQSMQRHGAWYVPMGMVPFLVERWLNLTEPSNDLLNKIHHDLQLSLENQRQWLKRIGSYSRLLEIQVRTIERGELTPTEIRRYGSSFLKPDDLLMQTWANNIRPYYVRLKLSSHFRRANHVRLRLHQLADRLESMASLPPGEAWTLWKAFEEVNRFVEFVTLPVDESGTDALPSGVRFFVSHFPNLMRLHFEQEAQLGAALTCVAAERYRRDHGRLPTAWVDLVPGYLEKELLDPFTGRPLVIKPITEGLVVYSLGRHAKDEGGVRLNHTYYWNYGGRNRVSSETNVGIRLLLPAHRRGTPIELEDEQIEAINKWRKFTPPDKN
jgi:hypothetical protein